MNERSQSGTPMAPDPAAVRLIGLAREKGIRLTAAESCTGGLLAAMLTAVPGASEALEGTLVAYSAKVKESLPGFPAGLIRSAGIVSEAVAAAMARGAASLFSADLAAGITGWAGPDGGDGQAPGTVCIATFAAGTTRTVCRHFEGDRNAVRLAAAKAALEMLTEAVLDGEIFPDKRENAKNPGKTGRTDEKGE